MNPSIRGRLVFFAVLLLIVLVLLHTNIIHRLVYPFHYRETIVAEAEKNDQDPRLIAAIIWVESRFKKEARSPKGAMGLMQIMPQTGYWVAEQARIDLGSEEDLLDPGVNIAVGTWYFNNLVTLFEGNVYAAMAAYNGGRGHVSRWLETGLWDGTLENVDRIPFPETREFVLKVVKTYERYQKIYNK